MSRMFLSAILWFTVSATNAAAVGLLVIPFENATGQSDLDDLADGIDDLLTACFSSYPDQVAVVDRSALAEVVNEQALGWQGYVERHSMADMGRLAQADYLLRGSLTDEDGRLRIQALLFSLTTTQLLHTESTVGTTGALMTDLCDTIASSIADYLSGPQGGAMALEPTSRPEQQSLMIEGLGHYYNGHHGKAIAAFLELVQRFPKDSDAHYWLGQGMRAGSLNELAAVQFRTFLRHFPDDPRGPRVRAEISSLKAVPHTLSEEWAAPDDKETP